LVQRAACMHIAIGSEDMHKVHHPFESLISSPSHDDAQETGSVLNSQNSPRSSAPCIVERVMRVTHIWVIAVTVSRHEAKQQDLHRPVQAPADEPDRHIYSRVTRAAEKDHREDREGANDRPDIADHGEEVARAHPVSYGDLMQSRVPSGEH